MTLNPCNPTNCEQAVAWPDALMNATNCEGTTSLSAVHFQQFSHDHMGTSRENGHCRQSKSNLFGKNCIRTFNYYFSTGAGSCLEHLFWTDLVLLSCLFDPCHIAFLYINCCHFWMLTKTCPHPLRSLNNISSACCYICFLTLSALL